MEAAIESGVWVSNNDDEKFGIPQEKHIQLTFEVMPLYTGSGMFIHLEWYHVLHESHAMAFWFDLQGLWHTPHGNFHTGPGLGWQSPDKSNWDS